MVIGILFLSIMTPLVGGSEYQEDVRIEKEKVMKWRKERDQFFKTHQRSPLRPADQRKI